jgi:glycerol-3-phosphate dehydrogenase
MAVYGLDKEEVLAIGEEERKYRGWLSEELNIHKAQVAWAVRKEMARTVEDFLARRTRALFLDARESLELAPKVADLMARELNEGRSWKKNQINSFEQIAKNYFFNQY